MQNNSKLISFSTKIRRDPDTSSDILPTFMVSHESAVRDRILIWEKQQCFVQ